MSELVNEYIGTIAPKFNEARNDGKKIYQMRDENSTKGLIDIIGMNFPDSSGLVGLEIGSYAGESATAFLSTGKFDKLYCIDAWTNGYDDNDIASNSNLAGVEALFDSRLGGDARVAKIKGFSYDVADKIPDGSLDFLYIDSTHTYEGVFKDLTLYFPKVKTGGIIAGHDYCMAWQGVMRAVDEFFGHKPEKLYCDTSWSNTRR